MNASTIVYLVIFVICLIALAVAGGLVTSASVDLTKHTSSSASVDNNLVNARVYLFAAAAVTWLAVLGVIGFIIYFLVTYRKDMFKHISASAVMFMSSVIIVTLLVGVLAAMSVYDVSKSPQYKSDKTIWTYSLVAAVLALAVSGVILISFAAYLAYVSYMKSKGPVVGAVTGLAEGASRWWNLEGEKTPAAGARAVGAGGGAAGAAPAGGAAGGVRRRVAFAQ